MPDKRKLILPCIALAVMFLSFIVSLPTGEMIVSMGWNGIAAMFVMTLTLSGIRKEGLMASLGRTAGAFTHIGAEAAFFAAVSMLLAPFVSSPFAVASLVPAASEVLDRQERKEFIPRFAALIAIASSAGGMLLPAGSPQSMMLHKSIGEASFIASMLPFFLLSIPVAALMVPAILGRRLTERTYITEEAAPQEGNRGLRMLYVCLAAVVFLTSLSLFQWPDIVIFTAALLLVFDRSAFLKADWSLFASALLFSVAGSCLGPVLAPLLEEGAFWKALLASAVLGSFPVASVISGAGAGSLMLLEAVNAGSLWVSLTAAAALSSLPRTQWKGFFLSYVPAAAVMTAVYIATAVI